MTTDLPEETTPETTADTPDSPAAPDRLAALRNNPPLLIAIAVAALSLCAVCILGVLLLREFNENDGLPLISSSDGNNNEPTPTALAPIPPTQESILVTSPDGVITVTVGTPTLLKLPTQDLTVQTDVIAADGIWAPTFNEAGKASWVNGTIINYVLGLPDTPENEALLTQMALGDEIQLITNGRSSYTYTFAERELVPRTDTTIYNQQMPGITLILLETDGDQRLVVHGRYVIAEVEENAPQNVVNMGETAQLDNVQVTVNSATYVADRAEIPAGFAFFQVDYSLQNVGLTALDTSTLQMTLVDELGNRYALSSAASQSGNYPVLNGFINANQVVNATAGYQVPLGLNSESVSWVVTNNDTNNQVFVSLPFTGGESAVQGASISLFRAEVSSDLTSLNLGGQITNLGTQPLIVTENDIQLSSPDGTVYLLLSTNPPLPWTIAPGNSLQFFVTYQRPGGGTAIFHVLNQDFQITEQ